MSGRGKSQKTLDLVDAAIRVLEEIEPATVRAVAYRLFVEGFIDSMSKNNTNMVSRNLVWAREQELVPWEYIVDETREAERVSTWSNPEAIIKAAVRGYRKDYWATQPEWIEVWSEKGTVRGTLAPVLDKYGVTFRVMHGFGSATSLHDIAAETAQSDKPLTILYVGDWDPSGCWISAIDVPERIARYKGSAEFVRVALNAEDVGPGTKLPGFPADTKRSDTRYRWFREHYGPRCWELDALSPPILRERIEAEILEHIDQDAWNHAIEVERAEVESMQSILGTWRVFRGKPRNTPPRGSS